MEYPVTINTEEEAQQFTENLVREALEAQVSDEEGRARGWLPKPIRCALECAHHSANPVALAACVLACMQR